MERAGLSQAGIPRFFTGESKSGTDRSIPAGLQIKRIKRFKGRLQKQTKYKKIRQFIFS